MNPEKHNNKMSAIEKMRLKVVTMLDLHDCYERRDVRNMIIENVALYPNLAKAVINSFDDAKPVPRNLKDKYINALKTSVYYVNQFGQALKYD